MLKASSPDRWWLYASLAVPLYYGFISLSYALSQDGIVQDDARQHVIWFQQWTDPALFPNDPIAHYFMTLAPIGYKSVYWGMAQMGIEPSLLAKVLPIGLGAIATIYLFYSALHLFPVPLGAFITTLIFNQHLWLNDDLISATPRAFVYPLFAAFLYYLLTRSLVPCLIVIILQGLFFPQLVFLELAILTLRLVHWQGRSLRLSSHPTDRHLWLGGVIVGSTVLLPFALHNSEFGAVITAAQMKTMPEYGLGGRSEYFGVDPFNFMFNGASGLRIPVFPSIILVGFGLPWVQRSRLPLVNQIQPAISVLTQITIASLGLFALAHLLLLKLHFPNRYTYHTFRFVLAIASGIVLTNLLTAGWHWWQYKRQSRHPFSLKDYCVIVLTGVLTATVTVVPATPVLFLQFQNWVRSDAPEIYTYLAAQPKDSLVASLADQANNLPSFSHQSTLVGREFALGHHPQYYHRFQQRIIDLLRAQYSPDPVTLKQVIDRYHITFWLLESTSFNADYLRKRDWLIYSSFQSIVLSIIEQLQQGNTPALLSRMSQCTVRSTNQLILLKADCLIHMG